MWQQIGCLLDFLRMFGNEIFFKGYGIWNEKSTIEKLLLEIVFHNPFPNFKQFRRFLQAFTALVIVAFFVT